jgi:hypothetical protein
MPDDPNMPGSDPGGSPAQPSPPGGQPPGVAAGGGGGSSPTGGVLPPQGAGMGGSQIAMAGAQAQMSAQGKVVIKILERMLPVAGSSSALGRDLMKMLSTLSKHFGEQTDEGDKNSAMMALLQRAMAQRQMGQGAAGGPQRGPVPALAPQGGMPS